MGYDAQGKRKRKAFYGKTRKEVQEKLTAALNDVNTGTYIDPSKITMSEWLDVWLKDYKLLPIKASTYSNYESYIRCHIKPELGNYALKDLRNETIQRFVNNLVKKGLSNIMVRGIFMVLKMVLGQAVTNEMILRNPADNIELPKVIKKEAKALSLEEQEKFIELAPNYKAGEIFILMLYTGLRIGEAVVLTWDDIDFENKFLTVSKTQTHVKVNSDGTTSYHLDKSCPKTKSSIRKIPLIPKMITLLEKLKNENDKSKALVGESYNPDNYIFVTSTGRMYNTSNLRIRFQRIADKIGITDAHPHTLRHTFATRGLEQGIPLKVMQEILGHSDIKMTANIYTHVSQEQKQINMLKMESI